MRGDKLALYELGGRYERGEGVPVDLKRAKRLYHAAAATTPSTIFVYSPQMGQSAGRVIPVNTGRGAPGLPDARKALERVETLLAKRKTR